MSSPFTFPVSVLWWELLTCFGLWWVMLDTIKEVMLSWVFSQWKRKSGWGWDVAS